APKVAEGDPPVIVTKDVMILDSDGGKAQTYNFADFKGLADTISFTGDDISKIINAALFWAPILIFGFCIPWFFFGHFGQLLFFGWIETMILSAMERPIAF